MENHLHPLVSVDLRSFSDRAAAWTAAHREHLDETRARALSLAAEARAQEESQALANIPTTSPPATTAAPTTTVPPTTESPPTTTIATDEAKGSETDDATKSSPTTTTAPPSTTTATTTGPTEEQWEALRQCESTGNYSAVSISPAARYRGAYQFSRSTWDWVAPQIGADYLVGVDPAEASPADQDRMALALWEINGWAPWPACSKRLGYL